MDKTMRVVTFNIGKDVYGIDISYVSRVVEIGQIVSIPEVPEFILGLVNVRSEVIPVIDLRMRLGFGRSKIDKQSKLLIVNAGENKCGFLVETFPSILAIDKSKVISENEDISTKIDARFISGFYETGLILLDVGQILKMEVE